MFHGHLAVRHAPEAEAGEVKVRAAGRFQARGRALVIDAAQHRLHGERTRAEDFLRAVDVMEEHLERPQALADPGGKSVPFPGGKNLWKQVAVPRPAAPRAVAGGVETDAHLAHGGLQALVHALQIAAIQPFKSLVYRFIHGTKLPGGMRLIPTLPCACALTRTRDLHRREACVRRLRNQVKCFDLNV